MPRVREANFVTKLRLLADNLADQAAVKAIFSIPQSAAAHVESHAAGVGAEWRGLAVNHLISYGGRGQK